MISSSWMRRVVPRSYAVWRAFPCVGVCAVDGIFCRYDDPQNSIDLLEGIDCDSYEAAYPRTARVCIESNNPVAADDNQRHYPGEFQSRAMPATDVIGCVSGPVAERPERMSPCRDGIGHRRSEPWTCGRSDRRAGKARSSSPEHSATLGSSWRTGGF